MTHKVFIDGQAGTTGLRLADRLGNREDIELLKIDEVSRKDIGKRLECISEADVAVLCLPDYSAREISGEIEKAEIKNTQVIDCSTANRTKDGWLYGIPELFSSSTASKRIANPGCHATGFVMSVRPLVLAGIIDTEAVLSFHSLTGYSGGGKAMIAEYEAMHHGVVAEYEAMHNSGDTVNKKQNAGDIRKQSLAPRQYALAQTHKHIPEMRKYSGLMNAPVFSPIVCDFYNGMLVSVPLPQGALKKSITPEDIREELTAYYNGRPLVKVRQTGYEFTHEAGGGFLSADAFKDRDDIEIIITGNDDRIEIVSRYDNLGKGASGAAIQNMNLMLGIEEETGLTLGA